MQSLPSVRICRDLLFIMFPRKKKTTTKKKRGTNERKTWIDKLDKVFSMYIRLRDSRAYHFAAFRCISCGDVKPFSEMDCGHFVSRNCMPLRWNSQNCNGECASCNRFHGDHLLGYRKNLILKLGQEAIKGSPLAESLDNHKKLLLIKKLGEKKVEALEAQKYDTYKWSIEELKELYMYYGALVLELKNEM